LLRCAANVLTGNRSSGRLLWTFNRRSRHGLVQRGDSLRHARPDGPQDARRDGASLALNQGTIYPALLRLEQKGWIHSQWGTSENNRRARFYAITRAGTKQLAAETDSWARTVAIVTRMLEHEP
jgi:DNA-binding MarR family transcriptional regulator